MGEGQMVARALAEELAVAYAEDTGPNSLRYVSWADLQHWEISPDGLHQVCLWNLEEISRALFPVVFNPPDRRDPMFIWNVRDGYDASRILLHHWLAEAAGQAAGDLVLGVPDRHWLVATGSADGEKLRGIRRRVQDRYHRAEFPISPLLYVMLDGRLTELPE